MSRNLAGFSNDSLFAGSPNGQQAIEREELYGEDKLQQMEEQKIDAYVPDSHLAHELNRGRRVRGHGAAREPAQRRMRRKLSSPAGRATYGRRKKIVEPVCGTLKEQYVGKETDCKWEEGDDISVLKFKGTEYGREKMIVADPSVRDEMRAIGIRKVMRLGAASQHTLDTIIRGDAVKRQTYEHVLKSIEAYKISK